MSAPEKAHGERVTTPESTPMIDTTRSFEPCGQRLLLTIKRNRTTSLLLGTRRSRNVMLPQ